MIAFCLISVQSGCTQFHKILAEPVKEALDPKLDFPGAVVGTSPVDGPVIEKVEGKGIVEGNPLVVHGGSNMPDIKGCFQERAKWLAPIMEASVPKLDFLEVVVTTPLNVIKGPIQKEMDSRLDFPGAMVAPSPVDGDFTEAVEEKVIVEENQLVADTNDNNILTINDLPQEKYARPGSIPVQFGTKNKVLELLKQRSSFTQEEKMELPACVDALTPESYNGFGQTCNHSDEISDPALACSLDTLQAHLLSKEGFFFTKKDSLPAALNKSDQFLEKEK